jgi:hypothetical protein
LDAVFFRLTALGATLRDFGAAFFIFFFALATGRILLTCARGASSHNKPSANGKTDAVRDHQIYAIQP